MWPNRFSKLLFALTSPEKNTLLQKIVCKLLSRKKLANFFSFSSHYLLKSFFLKRQLTKAFYNKKDDCG